MQDIKTILNGRPVVFIGTNTIGIDRGWEPIDVRKLLEAVDVQCHFQIANRITELEAIISKYPNALYWPVCYNLSHDSLTTSIMEVFENNNLQYIGVDSRAVYYSSKINFKNAVRQFPEISTPDFELIDSTEPVFPKNLWFPAMLKTEFSCNSEGVRKVSDLTDFFNANTELRNLYQQRHFVESWEREAEYTVAFIPATKTKKAKIAPVCLKVLNYAEYIDIPTKADNSLVKAETVSDENFRDLVKMTIAITSRLNIDGHCRIDFIQNKSGKLFAIELNFQPFMSYPEKVSYFPNALIKVVNLDFKDQIFQIIEHAVSRRLSHR